MLVMGHSIDEQWDLIQQFEGFVEHALTDVVETWLGAHQIPSALTAAAGDDLLDGEGSFAALWNSQVEGVFTTYLTSVYDASSLALAHDALSQADLAAGLGVAGVPDDFSADFVHQTANKMVGVSDTVWQNIRTELAKGVAANEDIEQLADRVRTAASVSMPRALTVARTTVIAASNAGSYAQASLLAGEGGMRKRWVATEDNRVRPDHHNADGQTVAMTSPFSVGGWPMMYPGDPNGPADEVINCRCTISYEFDDIGSVCECGSESALVAAVKSAPKLKTPMGASCICPAVASLTPAGYSSKLAKVYDSGKKKVYADFQADGKITPSIGGAKIHKRLQQVITQNPGLLTQYDVEALLDVIDEQYALAGGKTSFKAKYEEWLQTNAGKKAVPQAVITPAAAPATVEPRGLALIKAPEPGNLKVVGGAGGTHGAQILVDTKTGERWIFKPYSGTEEFGAKLDVSTAKIQSRLGLPQPSTYTIRFKGKCASVQSMHDSTSAFGTGFDPLKLSESDVLDLQREQVLDWLISQHDSHKGNFLRLKNGHLVGVDKGQAFKFFGKDKLDWVYHPNKVEAEPVYNLMWRAFAEGKNIEMYDPSTGAIGDLIKQAMAIPDDEYRAYLRPYVEQALHDGKLAIGDIDKFLDAAVVRKNNLAADFQKMYDKALAERTKVLAPAPAPAPVVTPAAVTPAVAAPAAVGAPAAVDYLDLWGQLDTLEQDNFIKAFKDAKSYHDSGAPLDEVMNLLKEDIKDNPSVWKSVVKNSGTEDLKGLIKVAGDALGDDTSWLGVSGTPTPLIAPAGDPANLAAAKSVLHTIDLDALGAELKYQIQTGAATIEEAVQLTINQLPHFMSKQAVSAVENLTDDQIFALVKDYQTSVGQSSDWIDIALASKAPIIAPASTAVDLLDISGVPDSLAQSFYKAYKKLKPVTPSWGGAAIYKNLQAIKASLGPDFAGLNDGQLLKLLDKVWYQNAKAGSKSYYDEVTSWLKTPGGKKYLKDNGIMPPPEPGGVTPAATKAPSVPPAAPVAAPVAPGVPVVAPAKKAAKKAPAKKVPKPPAILDTQKYADAVGASTMDDLVSQLQLSYAGNGGDLSASVASVKAFKTYLNVEDKLGALTDDQFVATLKAHADKTGFATTFPMPSVKMKKLPTPAMQFTSAAGDISGIEPGVKQIIFDKIKAQSVYLSSAGQKIWDTLGPIEASLHGKYTKLQLVRILDEMSAAKFGVTNTNQYEQKLVKWLKTAQGKQHASGVAATPGGKGALPPIIHPTKGALFNPGPLNYSSFVSTPETYDIISNAEAYRLRALNPPLTAAQKAGMKVYTGSSYSDMNAALRSGQAISDTLARHIRAAQSGMHPSTRPMLLHRGTGADQFSNLGITTRNAPFADIKALEGMEFTDEAFGSYSVGGTAAFGGKPVLIELEAPTGTSMTFVDDFSNVRGENEMLLAAGLRFKIISVSQKSGGGYYSPIVVRMRVLPP